MLLGPADNGAETFYTASALSEVTLRAGCALGCRWCILSRDACVNTPTMLGPVYYTCTTESAILRPHLKTPSINLITTTLNISPCPFIWCRELLHALLYVQWFSQEITF